MRWRSGISEVKGTRKQGNKDSGIQGIRESGNQGIRDSGIQGFRESGFWEQGIWVMGVGMGVGVGVGVGVGGSQTSGRFSMLLIKPFSNAIIA